MKAIMYHYVRSSNKNMPYFIYLSKKNFIEQLDYFEKEYGFVSYKEFISFIHNKSSYENIKNKILLTFDDGFTDHYENVFPELKKRGLFGIFYVPTGVYNKRKALDVHRIHYLLGKVSAKRLLKFIESKIQSHMIDEDEYNIFKQSAYTHQNNDSYTQEFKKIFNYYLKYEFREALLDELVREFSDDKKIFNNLYMSIEQIQDMQNNGMIIGSHSVNHFVLSKLSKEEQFREIHDSFLFLQDALNKLSVKTFCYPYGGLDTFNNDTKNILDSCKCDFSFSTQARDITESDFKDSAQALPRYDCNQFPYGKASIG